MEQSMLLALYFFAFKEFFLIPQFKGDKIVHQNYAKKKYVTVLVQEPKIIFLFTWSID